MKNEYIGYILAVVSMLLGIIVSWYFYEKSQTIKIPIYASEIFQDKIYNIDENKKAPFKVIMSNGKKINKNIYLTKHYFWNKGSKEILKSDILKPIEISITNKKINILSVEIERTSRNLVNCKLSNISKNNKRYTINFTVLEQYDGCSIKIFYSGDKYIKYSLDGAIIGVKNILSYSNNWEDLYKKRAWYSPFIKHIGSFILIFIIVALVHNNLKNGKHPIEFKFIFPIFILVLLIFSYLFIDEKTRHSFGVNIDNEIPFTKEWKEIK